MLRANYVSAKQNGRHLIDPNGFKYRISKDRTHKTYYECVMRKKLSCPATAVVLKSNDTIISQNGSHNHDTNLLLEKVRKLEFTAISNAADNFATAPRTVLGNLTNKIASETQSGVSEMRKTATLQRAVQRARNNLHGFPKVPTNWEEVNIIGKIDFIRSKFSI